MKPFKSLVIVKHPLEQVWTTIRDRLPELAPTLDDVASITVVERRALDESTLHLVNEWRVKFRIPAVLASVVSPEMLGWVDRADWHKPTHVCSWAIEPFFLPEAVRCSGTTAYEPAIGGRGTRITFAGTLAVDPACFGPIAASLGVPISSALESVVTTLIPKNFRKTIDALEKLLET